MRFSSFGIINYVKIGTNESEKLVVVNSKNAHFYHFFSRSTKCLPSYNNNHRNFPRLRAGKLFGFICNRHQRTNSIFKLFAEEKHRQLLLLIIHYIPYKLFRPFSGLLQRHRILLARKMYFIYFTKRTFNVKQISMTNLTISSCTNIFFFIKRIQHFKKCKRFMP